MILVIWSDLKDWYLKYATRSITYFLGGLGIMGFITFLRPKVIFGTLVVEGLWLGLTCGKETFSSGRLQDLIFNTKLKPATVVAGKAVFSLLLCLLHIFICLPLLLLTALYRGLSFDVFIEILILVVIVSALSTAFALIASNVLTDVKDSLLGGFMLGAYLVLTAIFEGLKRINPIYGVLHILTLEQQGRLGYSVLLNTLLLLGSLIVIWIPYRTGKRDEG